MKKIWWMSGVVLSLLIFPVGGALLTADEGVEEVALEELIEEFGYGTVVSISAKEIRTKESDLNNQEIEVVYVIHAQTLFKNADSYQDIAVGDDVEIDYVVKDGQNMASLIFKDSWNDTEEGIDYNEFRWNDLKEE